MWRCGHFMLQALYVCVAVVISVAIYRPFGKYAWYGLAAACALWAYFGKEECNRAALYKSPAAIAAKEAEERAISDLRERIEELEQLLEKERQVASQTLVLNRKQATAKD